MAKDSWVKNSELSYINSIDSCQITCSTEKFDSTNEKEELPENIEKNKSKLISADEIAKSYISNQKDSTIIEESHLLKATPTMGEFGHFIITQEKKDKMLNRYNKNVFEINKDSDNKDNLSV